MNHRPGHSFAKEVATIDLFSKSRFELGLRTGEAGEVTSFGNLPLIVLTTILNTSIPGWQDWQTELPQLSTHSQQLYAEKSGHNIEIKEPQAAVAAIIQMVDQVR